jgi:Co/Zn/Cd efflux system component
MAHNHEHRAARYNRAFGIGIGLNIGFVIFEAVFGILSDSLALLADAGHNLGDVLGLVLAWGAHLLSSRTSTRRPAHLRLEKFDHPGGAAQRHHPAGCSGRDRLGGHPAL